MARSGEEALSVKMCEKALFFFLLNTHPAIGFVNASFGSERFRMYLDGPRELDPTRFPASFITLFFFCFFLFYSLSTLAWKLVLTQSVGTHEHQI